MLQSSVDLGGLQSLKGFQKINPQILTSCLRSVSFGLNKGLQAEARSIPNDYAPITKALRKGRGYGPWFARFTRYFVDPGSLTALIGILDAGSIGGLSRFRPVGKGQTKYRPMSAGFAQTAERLARGYTFKMTRRRQKALAKQLYEKTGKKKLKTYGGYQRAFARAESMIPRVGFHRTKKRPIVEPYAKRNRTRIIRDLAHLYKLKVEGVRWEKGYVQGLSSIGITPGG